MKRRFKRRLGMPPTPLEELMGGFLLGFILVAAFWGVIGIHGDIFGLALYVLLVGLVSVFIMKMKGWL